MCSIVIPIYSQYADNIYNGKKKYEYRKIAPSKKIDYLILYETKPVCSITGIAEVKDILKKPPNELWNDTKRFAGISHKAFMDYFGDIDVAVAYELGNFINLDSPLSLHDININNVPQSFQYVDEPVIKSLAFDCW